MFSFYGIRNPVLKRDHAKEPETVPLFAGESK